MACSFPNLELEQLEEIVEELPPQRSRMPFSHSRAREVRPLVDRKMYWNE
jgi:hypothetical protein